VSNELLRRNRRILRIAAPRLAAWIATLATIATVWTGPPLVGALLAATLVGLLWWLHLAGLANAETAARAALVVALAVTASRAAGWGWPLLTAVLLLLAAILAESQLERLLQVGLAARRVPGLVTPIPARVTKPGFQAASAGLIALSLTAAAILSVAWLLVVVAVLLSLAALLSAIQLIRVRRHLPERELRTALTAYDPRYLLYYAGPNQGAYQLQMWLPQLARTGERGVLVVRDASFLDTALALSDLPVVYAGSVEALEYLMTPELRTVFYVNNDPRNVDGVRFAGVRHVFIGHGDSEKPSSYSAVAGMYDQIFVAGQAGADRYANHAVAIPAEKFVLVGRPQLAGLIERADGQPLPQHPTVLYAPTWRGGLGDMLLGSLQHGERIVEALLAAGARVIFRPHPLSHRDAESRVLIGRIDTRLAAAGSGQINSTEAGEMSVFECMNRSDALLADISSVVSDYLYADKPIAIAVPPNYVELIRDTRLARAANVLSLDADPADAVAALLGEDDRSAERAQVRAYYLGGWSPADYAEAFTLAARASMTPKT
jgi:hypothetical protein